MPALEAGEVIVDGIVDPWDASQNTIYLITTWRILKTSNLKQAACDWTTVRDIRNDFASNLSPAFARIKGTIAIRNRIYVLAYALTAPAASTNSQYVYVSSDGGSTWTRYSTGTLGTEVSDWNFDDGEQGWSVLSDDADYADAFWDSGSGRTGNGCLRVTFHAGGGERTAFWEWIAPVPATVAGGETFSIYRWINNGSAWGGDLIIRYTDDTEDSSFVSGVSDNTWLQYSVAVSLANAGKQVYSLRLRCPSLNAERVLLWDDAQTDIPFVSPGLTRISAFDVGQHNGNIVYAGNEYSIKRSSNGGSSWSSYITGVGAHDIECHYNGNPNDADVTFWGSDEKLYRSTGSTKGTHIDTEAAESIRHGRIVTYVGDKNVIYTLNCTASNTFKIRRTNNAGATWDDGAGGIVGARNIGLWPFGAHDAATQRVYVFGDNVYYSTDGGNTLTSKSWAGFASGGGRMYVPLWLSR